MSTNTILTILNTTSDAQLAETLVQSGLLNTELSSTDIEALAERFCELTSLQCMDFWQGLSPIVHGYRYSGPLDTTDNDARMKNTIALHQSEGVKDKLVYILSECPEYAAHTAEQKAQQ